jgi:hypothetical protein
VDDNTTFGTSNTDTVDFNARIASDFEPATDNTYDLGRTGHEWRDLYIDGTANIDSLIADTADINAGSIDGTTIGAASAAAATVTTLNVTSTIALNGSTGTSGYVLTSNGAGAPTWNPNENGVAIVDDTTTNATRYLTFTDATTGNITTENVSSTKLQFNPSTGVLDAANLTRGGSQVYSRNNIVNTVSESGGVPTGAIIERGSNANGEYVRFADGTQICWLRNTASSVTNTATYAIQGITYYRNLLTWTFPVAFSTATGLSVTNNTLQNDLNMFISSYNTGITTTSVDLHNLSAVAWSSFARTQVTATAVGRWF